MTPVLFPAGTFERERTYGDITEPNFKCAIELQRATVTHGGSLSGLDERKQTSTGARVPKETVAFRLSWLLISPIDVPARFALRTLKRGHSNGPRFILRQNIGWVSWSSPSSIDTGATQRELRSPRSFGSLPVHFRSRYGTSWRITVGGIIEPILDSSEGNGHYTVPLRVKNNRF